MPKQIWSTDNNFKKQSDTNWELKKILDISTECMSENHTCILIQLSLYVMIMLMA